MRRLGQRRGLTDWRVLDNIGPAVAVARCYEGGREIVAEPAPEPLWYVVCASCYLIAAATITFLVVLRIPETAFKDTHYLTHRAFGTQSMPDFRADNCDPTKHSDGNSRELQHARLLFTQIQLLRTASSWTGQSTVARPHAPPEGQSGTETVQTPIITTMISTGPLGPIIKAECTERAGFTYSPARGVVAAPFFERTSAALQCECEPAILRHERHGPENNLPLPQIRVLFPRLPAARKKDAGQDSWLGRSLPSPNPPLFAPEQQSHVRRHPPP